MFIQKGREIYLKMGLRGWWLDPYLPERTRDTPHLIITPNKSQRPTPANYIIYCIKTPPRYLPHLLLLPFTPIVFDICSSHSSSSLLAKLAPAEPSQSSYRYAAIQSASSFQFLRLCLLSSRLRNIFDFYFVCVLLLDSHA